MTLSLLTVQPARAQWNVVDENGTPLGTRSGGYLLHPSQTGTITRTLPPAGTSPVTLDPRADGPNLYLTASNADGSDVYGNYCLGYYIFAGGSYVTENGTITGTATGHQEARFIYTGPLPGPAYLNLVLSPTLSASAQTAYDGYLNNGTLHYSYLRSGLSASAQISATVTPSFSSAFALPVVSASASDATQPNEPGGPETYSYQVQTLVHRYIIRVPVINGVARVSLDSQLSASAANSIPYLKDGPFRGSIDFGPTQAVSDAWLTATIQQDPRAVAISSDIETSYFKAPDGYSGSPVQAQHYRNPDGSIAVDSAVGWINVPGDGSYPKGWQINSLPITANATDFQDPSYAWSISGLTIDQAGLELPLMSLSSTANFHLIEPDGNQFPLHCTVRVDVTDTDKAVAANTYDITWHLPYEKTALLGSVPEKVKLEKLYGPIGQGDMSDVQVSAARDIDVSEGCELAGGAAAATGQEELAAVLEIVGKLAKVTDAKYHYAGENIHKGTQNGQDKWTATLNNSDWAANVNNPDLLNFVDPKTGELDGWVFFDLEIYEVKYYHHITWAADKYNSHGYEGTGYTLHSDPVDKIDEEPFYTQVSSPKPH